MMTARFPSMQPFIDDLYEMRDCFDLSQNELGRRLLDTTADSILKFCAMQLDSDGYPWPELGHTYKEWKDTVAPGAPIGVLFGVMLNPEEVYGTTQILQTSASMTYGVTEEARRHATRFTEGEDESGWINHQPRDFYGINPDAVQRNDDELDGHFIATIR